MNHLPTPLDRGAEAWRHGLGAIRRSAVVPHGLAFTTYTDRHQDERALRSSHGQLGLLWGVTSDPGCHLDDREVSEIGGLGILQMTTAQQQQRNDETIGVT